MTKAGNLEYSFHIHRSARQNYSLDSDLFRTDGRLILANFQTARLFAQKVNARKNLATQPDSAVRAGQINAIGLIDELLHSQIQRYKDQVGPGIFNSALSHLATHLGSDRVDRVLLAFVEEFPPLPVYLGQTPPDTYLNEVHDNRSNRERVLEELLVLWLTIDNPACRPFLEFFDDSRLRENFKYLELMEELNRFFDAQPPIFPENLKLLEMLRSHSIVSPFSLQAQLTFLRRVFSRSAGQFHVRILTSIDLIKEEEKPVFAGPGPAEVYEYAGQEFEPEIFSEDQVWMEKLVIIAKNIYVWLDQLSRQHQKSFTKLSDIPDAELDRLGRSGFTGLWLIGVWQRSKASQDIKRMCGNPEASASAYSLFDYAISDDLGGETALIDLKKRAASRGIRLACDMVPNHMGIDSKWMMEHPEWFIAREQSPYPNYSFTGPNLSGVSNIEIRIEDHYYDRSDAAVVFQRTNKLTGQTIYIYHGNDGTVMPWNDTAQLDYMLPQVREAVIQTILKVSRLFPVIRFDAAMTLTRRHYQRLWFPEPGRGGAIPTRSDFSTSRNRFNEFMPNEFWREVVDRIAAENPNTLLLAEAFWLMEGYFVRSLGMHRVYNSAFMNMLRDEKNADYRKVIQNTLEFDPEILKRFVNFMNNPDERTAVDQFGKSDKYFGICMMMATMPGLPMFGHGQVEGFTEKYGMEYHRAYYDETPDAHLIDRHRREIFPLLHRRRLFAGIENFSFYTFELSSGESCDHVFAYSNRFGNDIALIIHNNKYASAAGCIRMCIPYAIKTTDSGKTLVQKPLFERLGLDGKTGVYWIFKDAITQAEFIRSNDRILKEGLSFHLTAYEHHAFLDWRSMSDDETKILARLEKYLDDRSVPDMNEAIRDLITLPVTDAMRSILNDRFIGEVRTLILRKTAASANDPVFGILESGIQQLVNAFCELNPGTIRTKDSVASVPTTPQSLVALLRSRLPRKAMTTASRILRSEFKKFFSRLSRLAYILHWILVSELFQRTLSANNVEMQADLYRQWKLKKPYMEFTGSIESNENPSIAANVLPLLLKYPDLMLIALRSKNPSQKYFKTLFTDETFQKYLGLNRFDDTTWYNKESFDCVLEWQYFFAVFQVFQTEGISERRKSNLYLKLNDVIKIINRMHKSSGNKVDALILKKRKKNQHSKRMHTSRGPHFSGPFAP